MFQIRENVFETNSSSSHSIVVARAPKSPAIENVGPNGYASYENGVLRLNEDNNFGWGWEVLTDWLDKFAYAVADLQYRERVLEDLLEKVKDRLGCSYIIIPRRILWNDPSKTEPDYGYVDHQSCGTLLDFLEETGVDILDFIFDERYAVILDNDNNYGEYHDAFIAKLDVDEYWAKPY